MDKNSNNVSSVSSTVYAEGKCALIKVFTVMQYSFIHSLIQEAS